MTPRQQALVDLLWDSMRKDPEHKDRVRTAHGTKTKLGLALSIERVFEETREQPQEHSVFNCAACGTIKCQVV